MSKISQITLSVSLVLLGTMSLIINASAQSLSGSWSRPLNLFETKGRASEAEVIVDSSGAVHVFWAYEIPDDQQGVAEAIYYMRQQDGVWSEPVDILVSPDNRVARMHSVVVDKTGYLHILWSASDAIFHSRAFAAEANVAAAWSTPQALNSGISALEPALALDQDNNLYAVWGQSGEGLIFSRSNNGGEYWSEPRTIYPARGENELARWGRIAIDDAGRLHVALTHGARASQVGDGRNNPNYLYYLRSDDGGDTWQRPFQVVEEANFGEINVVTYSEDMVHLLWNGRAGRHGRYHRYSSDGGETWSEINEVLAAAPEDPLGTGGLTGFPVMVADALGDLHLISATGGGEYYFHWQNGRWSRPTLISPGLDGMGVTLKDEAQASLEQPAVALSNGNQLHVVFHDGFQRIWYTTKQIDAPHQAAAPLPTVTPEATPLPTEAAPEYESTSSETDTFTLSDRVKPVTQPQSLPFLTGILPAALLVGLVITIQQKRRR